MIDDDEVIRIDLVGKRRFYSESAYNKLVDRIDEQQAEIGRLKAAIERHHRNVWGDTRVKHDDDSDLYSVLSKSVGSECSEVNDYEEFDEFTDNSDDIGPDDEDVEDDEDE